MKTKNALLATVPLLVLLTSACSFRPLGPGEASVSFRVSEAPGTEFSRYSFLDQPAFRLTGSEPRESTAFPACIALNVTGEGIPASGGNTDDLKPPGELPMNACAVYVGATSEIVPVPGNTTLQANVPIGQNRFVQVFGMEPAGGAGNDFCEYAGINFTSALSANSALGDKPSVFEMGRFMIPSLTGNTNIQISNEHAALGNLPRYVNCILKCQKEKQSDLNGAFPLGTTYWVAQPVFVPSSIPYSAADGATIEVGLQLARAPGTTAGMGIELYTDNVGSPGSLVGGFSNAFVLADVRETHAPNQLSLVTKKLGTSVLASGNYWLVIKNNLSGGPMYVGRDSRKPQQSKWSTDLGATWSPDGSGQLYFTLSSLSNGSNGCL